MKKIKVVFLFSFSLFFFFFFFADSRKSDPVTELHLNKALGGTVKPEIVRELSCQLVHKQLYEEANKSQDEMGKEAENLEVKLS